MFALHTTHCPGMTHGPRQAPRFYDLDMWRLNDEALVVLAQECGFLPARQELLVRHYEWMRRRIAVQAYARGLGTADREDAQGEGVPAILEAIARYDTGQMGKRGGRSFRSFLAAVVQARFRDFTRKLFRQRRRYRTFSFQAEISGLQGRDANRPRATPIVDRAGPHEAAVWHEEIHGLEGILTDLEANMRSLWQRLAAGFSLADIAHQYGVPYDRVRRWRRKLLAHIGSRVHAVHGRGQSRAPISRDHGE